MYIYIFKLRNALILGSYSDPYDNPFLYLWMMSQLISSCYAYTWDLKMDWGLLDKNAPPENKYLREEIVYSSGVCLFYKLVYLM